MDSTFNILINQIALYIYLIIELIGIIIINIIIISSRTYRNEFIQMFK